MITDFFVLIYSNEDDDEEKYKARGYYLPKGIIKNFNVIIKGKNFYDQLINSDIKRQQQLTTGLVKNRAR